MPKYEFLVFDKNGNILMDVVTETVLRQNLAAALRRIADVVAAHPKAESVRIFGPDAPTS